MHVIKKPVYINRLVYLHQNTKQRKYFSQTYTNPYMVSELSNINSQSAALSSIIVASFSSTATHTCSIKLTSRNYLQWKTQFHALLNYQNLTSFINGISLPPSKTITNQPMNLKNT